MRTLFDTENAIVAVPVVGETLEESRAQWRAAKDAGADMIEWRLDFLDDAVGEDEKAALAQEMKGEFSLPLLATYRTDADGGRFRFTRPEGYREVVRSAAGFADMVDVEISVPGSTQLVRELAATVPVVASFHDFTSGPSTGVTKQLLEHMEDLGAAVAKVAWMVGNGRDLEMVLSLQRWAAQNVEIPSVVIGMGPLGISTRLGESARISAFTFARGAQASAPGQPTVEEIRESITG